MPRPFKGSGGSAFPASAMSFPCTSTMQPYIVPLSLDTLFGEQRFAHSQSHYAVPAAQSPMLGKSARVSLFWNALGVMPSTRVVTIVWLKSHGSVSRPDLCASLVQDSAKLRHFSASSQLTSSATATRGLPAEAMSAPSCVLRRVQWRTHVDSNRWCDAGYPIPTE